MIRQAVTPLILLALFPNGLPGQGFGNTFHAAKTVTLRRLLPATVNLNQKRIRVDATVAMRSVDPDVVVVLKTKLTTAIQRDPRFIIDETKPETLLHFVVTNYYVEETHIRVGTGNNTTNCNAFTGKMEVSYQALEASTGAPLDSENLVFAIANEDEKHPSGNWGSMLKLHRDPRSKEGACGTSAKTTQHEAQDELVDQIVRQMYQRAAPSEDPIEVLLPGGKLEPLSSLAISQRWGKLEEDAMNAEKLPKPEEDAYRLYLIGLAKEAQAYDLAREAAARESGKEKSITVEEGEASFQRAQKLLDEARKYYRDALTAKSSEKEFREPDDRMEKAIQVYSTIERHKEEYQKYLAQQKKTEPPPVISKAVSSQPTPATAPVVAVRHTVAPAGNLTPLQQVVAFCQAGLDASSISDYVKDAQFVEDAKKTGYKWDFRSDAITLKQACADKAPTLQKQIRDRLASTGARSAR